MRGTALECIAWLASQEPTKEFDVSEHTEKRRRSLTQNAYYWVMLNRLAAKLRMPDSEVHMNMLREYGVCEVFSVLDDVPIEGYFRYYDVIGHGYANGRRFKHVRVYKGSSQMSSSEFSRLIDGMREECVLQGIDVATPQEIARMRWVEPREGGEMSRRQGLYGDERECFVCHTTLGVEMHHVWGGSRRPIADREGCVVPLCHHHHQHPRYGAHGWDKTLERRLRADCQRRWEEREVHESGISAEEARERFRATFYENYL